jgi:hypothetical protein
MVGCLKINQIQIGEVLMKFVDSQISHAVGEIVVGSFIRLLSGRYNDRVVFMPEYADYEIVSGISRRQHEYRFRIFRIIGDVKIGVGEEWEVKIKSVKTDLNRKNRWGYVYEYIYVEPVRRIEQVKHEVGEDGKDSVYVTRVVSGMRIVSETEQPATVIRSLYRRNGTVYSVQEAQVAGEMVSQKVMGHLSKAEYLERVMTKHRGIRQFTMESAKKVLNAIPEMPNHIEEGLSARYIDV